MAAQHFTQNDFDEKVLQSDKTAVIDFYAEWCGPCKMAEPVLNALADEYADKLVIGKINVDENQELAQQFGVMSIPTLLVFKEGKEVDRLVGFPGEQGYRDLMQKLV